MKDWWYVLNEKRLGPVSIEQLSDLLQRGEIVPLTIVWQQGMTDWLPIQEVPALVSIKQAIPPPIPNKAEAEKSLELPLATRWPRFFARLFDLWWEVVIISLVAGYTVGRYSSTFVEWINNPGSGMIFGILCIPFALLLDAVVYAISGNTPGKALLGLRVTTIRGERLSLRQYFDRNMDLWVAGLGFGIPVVTLFTMARQGGRVNGLKQTSYDEKCFTRVYAKRIGFIRGTVFGIFFCSLFVGMSMLHYKEQEQEREIVSRNEVKIYFWENPITGVNVPIQGRWKHSEQANTDGQKIFTFSELADRAAVVFAVEIGEGWNLDQYARAFQENVATEMKFSDGGIFENFNGFSSWKNTGVMVTEMDSRVIVRVIQIDNKFWRIVKVQMLPYAYSDEMLKILELIS